MSRIYVLSVFFFLFVHKLFIYYHLLHQEIRASYVHTFSNEVLTSADEAAYVCPIP